MLSSIRARILAACVAIVVFALVATTLINYFIARSYNDDAIDRNLTSVASGTWSGSPTGSPPGAG